jgi:hypothetical protein
MLVYKIVVFRIFLNTVYAIKAPLLASALQEITFISPTWYFDSTMLPIVQSLHPQKLRLHKSKFPNIIFSSGNVPYVVIDGRLCVSK